MSVKTFFICPNCRTEIVVIDTGAMLCSQCDIYMLVDKRIKMKFLSDEETLRELREIFQVPEGKDIIEYTKALMNNRVQAGGAAAGALEGAAYAEEVVRRRLRELKGWSTYGHDACRKRSAMIEVVEEILDALTHDSESRPASTAPAAPEETEENRPGFTHYFNGEVDTNCITCGMPYGHVWHSKYFMAPPAPQETEKLSNLLEEFRLKKWWNHYRPIYHEKDVERLILALLSYKI